MAPANKSTALAEVQEEVKQVRGLLAQFNTTQDLGQRQQLCWQLVQLCCVHAYKMLEAVYPVLERALGQGRMEQLLQQHCAVLKKLQAVDELSWHQLAADPGRHAQLTTAAVDAFLHHTAAEDEAVHAAGVEGLGARQLSHLDRAWVVAAYHAPTRPHPDSPLRPHARVVEAHLAEAPLDRAADHFRATVIVPHNAEMESRRAKLGVRHRHHHHHPSTHGKHAHGSKEDQVEETLTFITPTAAPAVGAGATVGTRKRRATMRSTSRQEQEAEVEGEVGADKSEEEDEMSEGGESEREVSDEEKSEEEGCEDEEKETKASQAALETGAVVQGGERAWHKTGGAMGRAVQAAAEPAGEMEEDDC